MNDEEIAERLAEGSRQFAAIDERLSAIARALEPLPGMQADLAAAKQDSATVKEIVEAWNAVKTGGKFVKWIAPIAGAVAGGWAAVKLGLAHFFGR